MSRFGTRVPLWLRYLCDTIVAPPGLAVGLGQGSELFGLVMAGPMSPHELTVDRDLHRIAHQADASLSALELVADSITGAGEAH